MLTMRGNKYLVGFASGFAEELTDQMIQTIYDGRDQTNAFNLAAAGGVSSMANFLGNKMVNSILGAAEAQISEKVTYLQSKAYKQVIKEQLKASGFRGRDRALNIAANKMINKSVAEARQEYTGLKVALVQAMERTIDVLTDKAKDGVKE